MHRIRGSRTVGRVVTAAALVLSALGCAGNGGGSRYVGRWECPSDAKQFIEIKANGGGFLVTESSQTMAGSLDKNGTLVVDFLGSVALPIDESTGELVVPDFGDGCKRYTKKSK